MGFPRILSKNNKIYTKLGEFCLSGDSFWIVCHTCQEELQTQDQFWKHIQDEHNFMHGVVKEHSRSSSYCLADGEAATQTVSASTQVASNITSVTVPLALYHCATKYEEDSQREVATSVDLHEQQQEQHLHQQHQQQQQQQQQRDAAKELAEMHANAVAAATVAVPANDDNRRDNSNGGTNAGTSSATGGTGNGGSSVVDIKSEPNSVTLRTDMQVAGVANSNVTQGTIYHLPPPAPPPSTHSFVNNVASTTPPLNVTANNAAVVLHQQQQQNSGNGSSLGNVTLPTLSMSAATGIPLLTAQELPPKYSNSATASASSAVSSDDGERWYICDYESCGLKFKYKSRMELHRVVHSKERRFNCDLCSASFKQSCNLSTHRRKKHALRGIKNEIQRF